MSLLICFVSSLFIGVVQSQTELTLPPLPYEYDALEPVLSERLMRLHHDKHHLTYTEKTNRVLKLLAEDPKLKSLVDRPIEFLLTELEKIPQAHYQTLRNNAGGYVNHKLFFSMLRSPTATPTDNKPSGSLLRAIEDNFQSYEKFQDIFTTQAMNLFGSGWVWLYRDGQTKNLVVNSTINQDNPIMFNRNHIVVLGLDLWEHAYYPVYENRRQEYVDNFWRVINWSFVAELFANDNRSHSDL